MGDKGRGKRNAPKISNPVSLVSMPAPRTVFLRRGAYGKVDAGLQAAARKHTKPTKWLATEARRRGEEEGGLEG
jgi:hypothetical protein